MLTIGAVKSAAPRPRAYKLFDAGGLFLFVTPAGARSWRLKYRWRGREKLLVLGRFPDMPLPAARGAREAARAKLASGIDPAKRDDGDSFELVARAWHRHQLGRWSTAHAGDVLGSLERDVFPAIRARPIRSIEPSELLAIVRDVEDRGRLESAGRLRQRLSAIFGFAIAGGKADIDVAAQLGRAMTGGKLSTPHPALLSVGECRALLADVAALAPAPAVLGASQLLALTAVRLDAVRGMRWGEVDGLDGAAPVWRVPPARMKLSRAKKGEDRFAHLVPLSPAAAAVLRAAAGRRRAESALVFPGRDPARPIGEATLRDLYRRAGYAGRHVPHGWRASFSTILNEELGERWSTAIDAALAHSRKDKVEAAYNRAKRLQRRRELMERWGKLLCE
ncbi:MAG TPA: integrase arm-type DNA-binding domain-containing protein [Sphingopyxis sp.]|nr:integrase arm-type DNA-binding domain-containing protein [Sphingopyxis sp.]HMP43885.1 integrase arm-type DNA-binding domain-containing protein [Sphingopyxis sp.]HMQ18514.1 integrase arm-type DNA-binding domain-containing protein [Sphingopyxis sp.]